MVLALLGLLAGSAPVAAVVSGGDAAAGLPPAAVTVPLTAATGSPAATPGPSPTLATIAATTVAATALPSASPTRHSTARPTPSPKPAAVTSRPATPTANAATRLRTLPATTAQVVIVHAPSAGSTVATLETFSRAAGTWQPEFAAMPARVGSRGIGTKTQEGVPMTPAGVYGFGATMYGVRADPGVRYAWHHLADGDYWDENPDSPTYNTFVHGADPGGSSEALWSTVPAYDYFAVITYNLPDAVPGKGSGIFLHVGTGAATAGCVSLGATDLVKVLTWLNPAAHPRIVIATDAGLSQY